MTCRPTRAHRHRLREPTARVPAAAAAAAAAAASYPRRRAPQQRAAPDVRLKLAHNLSVGA